MSGNRRNKKNRRIYPDNDDKEGLVNGGFELDAIEEEKNQNRSPFLVHMGHKRKKYKAVLTFCRVIVECFSQLQC